MNPTFDTELMEPLHPSQPAPITSNHGNNRTGTSPDQRATEPEFIQQSLRHVVTRSEHSFDVSTLPPDMRRVYGHLSSKFGEDYALTFVFTVRTAVELHRAWNMTLLTSKILQQIKDKFGMRMTWELGVLKLKFRVEDGGFELHRKVPYDYDSEFQDLYMKIAVALVEGHINVNEALIFQGETKQGAHTARSGLFLRRFPGRLVLYPLEAATCAVIFFSGDWTDGGIAAVCGLAAGCVECGLSWVGGDAKILIDVLVGTVTGVIGGLFYKHVDPVCLSAIFLGTLYWFFYGTAFVVGILEIIAGELETGVTRFIAVSVKTFVLCLGAGFGMLMTLSYGGGAPMETWQSQKIQCGTIDLDAKWWRIPLYLLCSASALGQYRAPLMNYWRGLSIQLVAYEVQYQSFHWFHQNHTKDNLDTAASNVFGAAAGVVTACWLSSIVDQITYIYHARLLQRGNYGRQSIRSHLLFRMMAFKVRVGHFFGIGRDSDAQMLQMREKLQAQTEELRDPSHPRTEIVLDPAEEALLVETIVSAEKVNVWSILMPAVYQLVPGSLIAKMWFNSIFPPPLVERTETIEGTELTYKILEDNPDDSNVFANLMVISTSLALGLIIGFAIVRSLSYVWHKCFGSVSDPTTERLRDRLAGMYTAPNMDPDEETEVEEEVGSIPGIPTTTSDEFNDEGEEPPHNLADILSSQRLATNTKKTAQGTIDDEESGAEAPNELPPNDGPAKDDGKLETVHEE